jgi:hypothetical protein
LSNSKSNLNPNNVKVGDRIRLIQIHDIHADVKQGDTGTVVELTTVPKGLQSNELDLVMWIKWDSNSKSRISLTEGVDQYEIIEK